MIEVLSVLFTAVTGRGCTAWVPRSAATSIAFGKSDEAMSGTSLFLLPSATISCCTPRIPLLPSPSRACLCSCAFIFPGTASFFFDTNEEALASSRRPIL